MIRLKFFHPPIDEKGMLRAYDPDVLQSLKETLHLTDAWVTYSWGFSDATEQEDREFLRSKLDNFSKLGLRTHAYVQGTNLVYDEHKEQDLWCRDHNGELIPYHRGRKLCCINNPDFRALLLARVEAACREDVGGVFVDNFHFGQFPVALGGYSTFFGCACTHCRSAFSAQTGFDIPGFHHLESDGSRAYLSFRTESVHGLARSIREITSAHGKEFGSNSFDLHLDTKLYYGFDPAVLQKIQHYLLFENFNHPSHGRSNNAHDTLIAQKKSVFIVSYKRVIGSHGACSQEDIDAVYSESKRLGYAPCYKASEFTTDRTWHMLDPFALRIPRLIELQTSAMGRKPKRTRVPFAKRITRWLNVWDVPFLEYVYESRRWRSVMGWLVDALTSRTMRKPKTQR